MTEQGGAGEPGGVGEHQSAPPTCYRHPGRESYIRCQRCGRTVCPECQTPASVGVHCPECVREANRSRPAVRTTFGGVVPRGDGAIVTKVIIGICVLTFLVQEFGGLGLVARFGMIGYAFDASRDVIGIADGEYYRLLTPVLLHGGMVHLFVNMLSLWFLGPFLEQSLGRARYVTLFVVGGIGGAAVSFALGAPNIVSVGASGAVFALVGALVPIYKRLRLNVAPVLVMIAINAFIGFSYPGIDWRAHLGGLVTGGLLGVAFAYAPRERRTAVHVGTVVAVLLVIVVVVVLRTAALRP